MADLFIQNVIAVIWDFDKTLIPGYMQEPIFRRFQVDGKQFWAEVDGLAERYQQQGITISRDIAYLNHLITYAQTGKMPGLNNRLLHELGRELEFYPGLPNFLGELKKGVETRPEFKQWEITLEHYVVSSGLAAMIRGSAAMSYLNDVWGCEFIENPLLPGYLNDEGPRETAEPLISQIGYAIDNTTKTRAVFEINKGTNKRPEIDVNASIPFEQRRVPFQNMIYIADGPSDVPVFSLVKSRGGKTYAVYPQSHPQGLQQADMLLNTGRVDAYGEASYLQGSQTYMWLMLQVERIARRIVEARVQVLRSNVLVPPIHL